MNEAKGRAKGGKARSEKLTPEERSEIARMGGKARWEEKIPCATHQGTLHIAGKELPCAVLDDGRRILTQKAVYQAFDRPQRGPRRNASEQIKVPSFMDARNLIPYITPDVEQVIRLVAYVDLRGKPTMGYTAEIIPQVCNLYLAARADGALTSGQESVAVTSEILVRALAQVGIVALVDEATGYQGVRPQDALQRFLEQVIRKELAAWVQRFPEEFFANIYKLKGWYWPGMKKNRYSIVGQYIKNLVYERLAPGVLQELERKNPKDAQGRRKAKHHQWLTDEVGHPMLAQHINAIMVLQRLAIAQGHGWKRFMMSVDMAIPKKGDQLLLPVDSGSVVTGPGR